MQVSQRCRGRARRLRRASSYAIGAACLTLIGIFAMRWNVVIGGQLFSKSFLGYTTYKMEFATREGLLPAILLMLLPFGILAVLVKVLPPWTDAEERSPTRGLSGVTRVPRTNQPGSGVPRVEPAWR